MSDDGPIYRARYNADRLHGVPNLWVVCGDIRLENNLGFPLITDLCRALKQAGRPDGKLLLYQDGHSEPRYEHPSIYAIVDRAENSKPKRKNGN